MYKFKFDTSKISWTKKTVTNNSITELSIKASDDNYYNNVFLPLLKNLVNIEFKFVVVEKEADNKHTWIIDTLRLVGFDMVNDKIRSGANRDNVYIEGIVREHLINSNIGAYEFYLIYK